MLLEVRNVRKSFGGGREVLHGVSLAVDNGECLGLVGESGSGKSTLASCILCLEKLDSGEIVLDGKNLSDAPQRELVRRRRDIQVVFQNPMSSFNPRLPLRVSMREPLDCFPERRAEVLGERSLDAYLEELVGLVHLEPELLDRRPRELSGGQLQRMAIARALSTRPKVVLFDEPTASLDVLVQAGVLNLLKDLHRDLGLSSVFISHDLAAVGFLADRIMVLKDGSEVETFPANEILSTSRAPYTRELVELFR